MATYGSKEYYDQIGSANANVINAYNLQNPERPVEIPQAPVDNNDYTGLVNQGNAEIKSLMPDTSGLDPVLANYLNESTPPPSTAEAYTQAQSEAGIDQKQQAVDLQTQKVNALKAQLAGLTGETQARELQIGKEAISAGAIQGRNIEEERNLAIRAIPLQAQILAEQATLTGNQALLESAQNKLNTLFNLKVQDAQNQYNYQKELRNAVYDYATKKEKQALDQQALEDDRDFQIKMENLRTENDAMLKQILTPETQQEKTIKDLQIQKLRQEISGGNMTFDGFLPETDVKKIDVSPQGKSVKALGTLKQKIQSYKDLVQKYGTSSFGKQKAQLESAYADLKIAYKEAANLGALTGPDVALLEEAIKPATSSWFGGQAFKVLSGKGKGTILSSLETALNAVNQNAVSNIQQLYARDPRYASSYYVQEIINPFKDEITLSDTQIEELTKGLSPEQIQQLKNEGLLPQ